MKNPLIFFVAIVLLNTTCNACYSRISVKDSTSTGKPDSSNVLLSESQWKEKLTAEQFYILREKGTDKPYTGKFLFHKEKGHYTCAACGNELFGSDSKFDSHCGWPSFDKEIKAGKIIEKVDNSLGMKRIEIICAKCGGHLGHVFDDGPTKTGLRYCVNSTSLGFKAEKEIKK